MDICEQKKYSRDDKTEGKNVLTINIITIRGSSNLLMMRKRR
jgi:hypothetical protein